MSDIARRGHIVSALDEEYTKIAIQNLAYSNIIQIDNIVTLETLSTNRT